MNTFVKINSINYPAEIYGHVRDRDWDNRESKVIVLALSIQEALDLFVDGLQWAIVYGIQVIPQDEFIIAGPITDNRNGTVSVRMGKPTAVELSNIITGETVNSIDLPTAYAMRAVIEDSVTALDDETAVTVPSLFTPWTVGEAVNVGDRRYYATRLYKVVQAHTTQADWTPDVTPALWAVLWDPGEAGTIDDPGDTYPEWVQPTGAHDAYNTGDRVTYNGRVYESTMDGNTWSPDAYPQGWEDLGEVTA